MRIYNYLFYKTYLLAQHSGNFDDVPVLGGMLFVTPCIMFNIGTFIFFLDGLSIDIGFDFEEEYKYVFSLSLYASILFYYSYKGRYKKIVASYEQKKRGKQLHPIFVIIIYYGISSGLLLLAGLYRNHYWIFKQ